MSLTKRFLENVQSEHVCAVRNKHRILDEYLEGYEEWLDGLESYDDEILASMDRDWNAELADAEKCT